MQISGNADNAIGVVISDASLCARDKSGTEICDGAGSFTGERFVEGDIIVQNWLL